MNNEIIKSLGTILGIWAHPDDETYLSAGIMAQAVEQGQRVICITATRGEGGSWDEKLWPSAKMGEVRDKELMNSLKILGVKEHHWLNYFDGKCAEVSEDEAIKKITKIIDEVHPDSILTFGPDGMTGHADHKAVCDWSTKAFGLYSNLGAKLFYATTTPEWAKKFVPIMNKFNVFDLGTPVTTESSQLAINFELPKDILELKLKAIDAHVSQVEGMMEAFGRNFFRRTQNAETFRLAKTKNETRSK